MKKINGVMAVLSMILAVYTVFTGKSNADLIFSLVLVVTGVLFFCFIIIEEKTDENQKLRIKLLEKEGIYKNLL